MVILMFLLYLATLVDVGDHVVGDHVVGDLVVGDHVVGDPPVAQGHISTRGGYHPRGGNPPPSP